MKIGDIFMCKNANGRSITAEYDKNVCYRWKVSSNHDINYIRTGLMTALNVLTKIEQLNLLHSMTNKMYLNKGFNIEIYRCGSR